MELNDDDPDFISMIDYLTNEYEIEEGHEDYEPNFYN